MANLFYLQDSRSNVGSRAMFWRDGGGYTSNLDEAGQFTREAAVKQYECRDTDLPYPVDYVRARAEVGVDCQYLTRSEAEAYRNEDGRVYVAYAREWDGNDLVWRGGQCPTANLDDAIHPGAADAAGYLAQGFELWPCGYIAERSRPVVRATLLDHKQALRSVGLKLPKLQRYRSYSNRLNCEGCGRFLSERQRFQDCPNCGARNAP
ncbi:hypothetical protein L5T15_000960 [Pseudomonas aeruginosa]|uniref:hypothetical protein n=1 Tax=Pseudomonas aeruginosa TaxID=287 RepID=UPI001CF004DF|nr:hypothetical protein [Pseudomonas aeruginosa]EIU1420728.1 hypothetical protein [Pseudomonas aeruginosa]EKU3791509.1 hypothetical protein [Pseudomonas aeruginosa]EKV3157775.1 hypothetical protein [Pseudomonas aeruginosa]EKX0258287.1 hypothetical protein [Pseudomonas aeruginosa]MDQ4185313.1 hypothetical protein [Pseudomonas aeruginosa]